MNIFHFFKNIRLGMTFILIAVLLFPQHALACSCAAPSVKNAFQKAFAVFSGKVTHIRYLDDPQTTGEPKIVVTFAVERSWKGPSENKIILHTNYNTFICMGIGLRKTRNIWCMRLKTRMGLWEPAFVGERLNSTKPRKI